MKLYLIIVDLADDEFKNYGMEEQNNTFILVCFSKQIIEKVKRFLHLGFLFYFILEFDMAIFFKNKHPNALVQVTYRKDEKCSQQNPICT